MIDRDDLILKHIGRYSLTIRSVLEELFFDGRTCDHVVNRLVKEGRIVGVPGIPGGISYYRLSLKEARARGVPEHRSRPKKGRALREAFSCCASAACQRSRETNLIDDKSLRTSETAAGAENRIAQSQIANSRLSTVSTLQGQIPETTI